MASEICKPENLVYKKTSLLTDKIMHYCPGCGHGTIHRTLMEVVDEKGLQDKTIGIAPVGCSVLAYDYMNVDMQEAAHGRAPAVATAIKRLMPEKFVFTYQGDGDLAAIGTAETIHACNRGEKILMVFVNNAIYGMTGGQMAPTTLEGMKTVTSPYGRDVEKVGWPLRITEMVSQLNGVYSASRHTVHTPAAVAKLKKALNKAIDDVMAGKGTCFIEVCSSCNSGWKMSPVDANKWMEDNVLKYFVPGDIKVDGKLVR
ncbi:MAG: 2-oxoglutarate oxidoreductase [Bacteroidales bacterium]|nr:2-oxoglutarate oxidoreductase [Bacteroidales bacterium]MDE7102432.1 2-oxoglutarate oxidoreductase [Bacteroidales bacterium]MDE7338744.1 2-oxoglutarate oxidoreductase [Bacteroidales bacterium]